MTSGVVQSGRDLRRGPWHRGLEAQASQALLSPAPPVLQPPRFPHPGASHRAEGPHTRLCSVEYQTGTAWAASWPNSEWIQDRGSHLGDGRPPGEQLPSAAGPGAFPAREQGLRRGLTDVVFQGHCLALLKKAKHDQLFKQRVRRSGGGWRSRSPEDKGTWRQRSVGRRHGHAERGPEGPSCPAPCA